MRTRKATSHVALWEGKVPVRANDKSKFEVGEELSRRKVRVPGRTAARREGCRGEGWSARRRPAQDDSGAVAKPWSS